MRLASFLTARRHDYPAAIENYYKALAASPGNIQVYWALGGAYIDSGNYDKATSLLQQAVQLGPSYWQTHYQLGMAYLRARKYPQATASLEKAADLTTDYRVSGSLSRIYALSGQSQKAQDSYQLAINQGEKLLQLNARDYDVHILVARYYAMIGKRLEALSHLSLALSSSANDPHYLVIAAACYLRLGDRTTTLNLMEQAIAHGATVVDIQAEPELDALKGDPRYIALISANQNKK
jgi:tetratricopeptide (TPR) repeat protein